MKLKERASVGVQFLLWNSLSLFFLNVIITCSHTNHWCCITFPFHPWYKIIHRPFSRVFQGQHNIGCQYRASAFNAPEGEVLHDIFLINFLNIKQKVTTRVDCVGTVYMICTTPLVIIKGSCTLYIFASTRRDDKILHLIKMFLLWWSATTETKEVHTPPSTINWRYMFIIISIYIIINSILVWHSV